MLVTAALGPPLGLVALAPAATADALDQGLQLPPRGEYPSGVLLAADSALVVHEDPRGPQLVVRSLADSEVVARLDNPHPQAVRPPTMVDGALSIWPTLTADTVISLDARTGEQRWRIDVGPDDDVRHVDDEWVLVERSDPSQVVVVWPDGGEQVVAEPGWSTAYVGGDSAQVVLGTPNGSVSVDLATGQRTPLSHPGTLENLSATHLLSRTQQQGATSWWVTDRETGESRGPFILPGPQWNTWLVGDDVLQWEEGPVGGPLHLVDTETGETSETTAEYVGAAPTGDGRVVLVERAPWAPLVVASSPTDLQEVGDLDLEARAVDVGLSGDLWVAAAETGLPGNWAGRLSDGGVEEVGRWWVDLPPFSMAGDVVLGRRRYAAGTLLLSWSDGTWRETPGLAGSRLGHDGHYLVRRVTADGAVVERARSGEAVETWTGPHSGAVDGHWWWRPGPGATVEGRDLRGVEAMLTVAVPDACADADVVDVQERWLLLACGTVVDLMGQVAPQSHPATAHLGNGFVAWSRRVLVDGAYRRELEVTSLGASPETRRYGPLWDPGSSSQEGISADDAGGARLAYVDDTQQVRVVELGWLPTVPEAPDTTAPLVQDEPQLEPVVAATPDNVALAWTFRDPELPTETTSGLAAYDVRVRNGDGGAWSEPAEWQGLSEPSLTVSLADSEAACWSARARDMAGNTSAWSREVCTTADGTPPTVDLTAPPALPARLAGSLAFSYDVPGEDGAVVDVEVRQAARDAGYGAWEPASVPEGASVELDLRAGEAACVRVRARDRVGNESAWRQACTTLPVDDRALRRRAAVRHCESARAIGSTCTEVGRRGRLVLDGQAGSALGLWVLKGRGLGQADVYAGGLLIRRVDFAGRRTRRVLVQLETGPFDGPVTIRQVGRRPVRVDAVAVQR